MTLLLNAQNLSKSYGSRNLFQGLSLSISLGDKIGLIGPNGSGKSTLLKIILDLEKSDEGTISKKRDLKIGYVPQTCDFPDKKPEIILFEKLQHLEKTESEKKHLVQVYLSKLGFTETETSAKDLSGGWKKRLSIAGEVILSPDLLFLDEPTNHLDLEGLLWLEKFLTREVESYLLVSHDRYFLQNTTNKIIEISSVYPKGMFAIDGSYTNFLEIKNQFLEGQLQQEKSLASKVRHEEKWLAQSPKARTTKSRARIEETNAIIEELSEIQKRNKLKKAEIDFASTERQTKKLMVIKNLTKKINDRTLFKHLDFTLTSGLRLGLIGPNGSGKTTLLRLIAAEILPDEGTIKKADNLQIVYFDQHRARLPDNITLREALCPNGDYVDFQGRKIHVNGWCKRFLFSPDILDMPIKKLSGGERARISIAHLLLQPADLLLLDEPTNDLDIPTLETLEESLVDFSGAVVLITHDRCMIDRTCTSILALGDEEPSIFTDYAKWEASRKSEVEPKPKKQKNEPTLKLKLSYAEKKEHEQIEKKIMKLEKEIKELNLLLESDEVIQNPARLKEICTAVALGENQIHQLYIRWEELDKKN